MNTAVASPPSVAACSAPLLQALLEQHERLRLGVEVLDNGATLVDAGIDATGGIEAGRRIAEICLGGLGRVRLAGNPRLQRWPWHVEVQSSQPVLACLASQYAGWSLVHGEGKRAFRALGSGPARALGSKEPLFAELGYRDRAQRACLVIETDRRPPLPLVGDIAGACNLPEAALCLILTPTGSLAGAVQIVARVLEVALHKAHELGFPLSQVVDGAGTAPLCPPSPDALTAMGRSNDAILFAGQVQLYVDCDDADARQLAEQLPSSVSKDYGRPFAEVFRAVDYDFYRIDPMLFSPAEVTVSSLRTGNSYHAGRLDTGLLEQSFGAATT